MTDQPQAPDTDTPTVPAAKPTGRPSLYSPELRDEICRRLAAGRTLRSVCRDADMPERPTIYDWYIHNKGEIRDGETLIEHGFSYHYDRAREIGLDEVADETMEIADETEDDFILSEDKSGRIKAKFDKEAVLRSKLRVENRWKYLENMAPRKYGRNVKVQSQALDAQGEPTDPPSAGLEGVSDFISACAEAVRKATDPKDA